MATRTPYFAFNYYGIATDYCVKFTVLDALKLGYTVDVLVDGCGSVNLGANDSQEAFSRNAKSRCEVNYINRPALGHVLWTSFHVIIENLVIEKTCFSTPLVTMQHHIESTSYSLEQNSLSLFCGFNVANISPVKQRF